MLDQQSLRSSQFSLDDADIERRKIIVDLAAEDISRITTLKGVIAQEGDRYTEDFFRYLRDLGEAPALFGRRDALAEAKRRKREHLTALTNGVYDQTYVDQRAALALLYSRYGLETRAFLGAFHHLLRALGGDIMKRFPDDPNGAFQRFMSVKKVAFFDIGIITDVLTSERERTISQQQEAIRELSTPVLQVRDGLLILPIIGMIDSLRAKQLTDSLLRAIRANRARMVVMDITGVAAVDSKVANHLIQTVAAARLMGSTVIITGLSADVAQALVALGVDLGKITTTADLQGGLEEAERLLGYRVVRSAEAPGQRLSA
ncbi:protoglobin domain-containing protein [Bradyrhizobium sp.]|uniref:protoglobin domain-containing protein n=1 Tax=Bradyrhizobium sp. TaxID=376 RepID=UPI001EB59D8E|nr:protoglobin domain-containing protein [Bradyrhizobium sp.]MBV8921759.1 STAS domain-containing protein [Bradyrhizobium sp.]MBV9979811.1 STAS domain-containing protein [Bradyrhizobium sp.]